MAFRLMDVDLVCAGAYQRGIHQAERTTRYAEITPARRLTHGDSRTAATQARYPARATLHGAARRCRPVLAALHGAAAGWLNRLHDLAAASGSAATICLSTWQARLTWLTDAPP